MIIKVVELCRVSPYEDGITEGLRTFTYESSKDTLEDAIDDIQENFDSDNIIESNDEFDGECLDSETIEYSIVRE